MQSAYYAPKWIEHIQKHPNTCSAAQTKRNNATNWCFAFLGNEPNLQMVNSVILLPAHSFAFTLTSHCQEMDKMSLHFVYAILVFRIFVFFICHEKCSMIATWDPLINILCFEIGEIVSKQRKGGLLSAILIC